MATKIGMPNLGHTMEEGTVVQWLKQEGEIVSQGDLLADVESDKVTFTIDAPTSGVLLRINVPAGTSVKVGHVLGYIGEPGEFLPETDLPQQSFTVASATPPISLPSSQSTTVARTSVTGERPRISPLARRLAHENGLDPDQLTGSGPGGSVTREDVLEAIAARAVSPAPEVPAVTERKPLNNMRRTIAQRMTQSWQQAPQVTQMLEADMGAA